MKQYQRRQPPNSSYNLNSFSNHYLHPALELDTQSDKTRQRSDMEANPMMNASDPVIGKMQADTNAPQINMKCAECEEKVQMQALESEEEESVQMQPVSEKEGLVQMQPEQITEPKIQKEDEEGEWDISPDATSSVPGICALNPEFPDFNCFLIHLKRNIDTNLYNNAHHFMRIARLYPDDSQMMEDAFMRYGLGVNILETSYQFLGADAGLATGLAYGTGIGLKALDFFGKGELMLDFQINLAQDLNLDLQLDLNANPDNLLDIRGASAGVGFSGHF